MVLFRALGPIRGAGSPRSSARALATAASLAIAGMLLSISLLPAVAGAQEAASIPFYRVDRIREAARTPKPGLVLLAAHRGVWTEDPENTVPALQAAVDQGFETVEIDVRLSLDGTPWLVHDFLLERNTTAEGYLSSQRDVIMRSVRARDRHGEPAQVSVPSFADALLRLSKNLYIDDEDVLRGFVLVVDLKSPAGEEPQRDRVTAYRALQRAWQVVKEVSRTRFPDEHESFLGQAVIFKMKAREFPATPADLERALGLTPEDLRTHSFNIQAVLHPDGDNRVAGDRVIDAYFDKSYMIGFEAVSEFVNQPGAETWLNRLKANNRTVPGFPSWSDYAEGFARSDGTCCVNRDVTPGMGKLDYTGSFEYHLQIGANWLTSDIAPFLHDYLTAIGRRQLDQLRQ